MASTKKKYVCNKKTCKLHIVGFCRVQSNPDWCYFDTEDEALALDGEAVGVCKIYSKRRGQK